MTLFLMLARNYKENTNLTEVVTQRVRFKSELYYLLCKLNSSSAHFPLGKAVMKIMPASASRKAECLQLFNWETKERIRGNMERKFYFQNTYKTALIFFV